MKHFAHLLFIFLFSFLSILNAKSQNNDSLITSQTEKTTRKYIIELDTANVIIKETMVESGKETLIKRKKKIHVVMVNGSSYTGRWEIVDENTISINNFEIPISDIVIIDTKMKTGGKVGIGVGIGVVVVGVIVGVGFIALIIVLGGL